MKFLIQVCIPGTTFTKLLTDNHSHIHIFKSLKKAKDFVINLSKSLGAKVGYWETEHSDQQRYKFQVKGIDSNILLMPYKE